jgi:hypothetical protein
MKTSFGRSVYELRCYDIKPEFFPAFLQAANKHYGLRTAYSRMCGFWTVEAGAQNQVMHLWEYDGGIEQRAKVRADMAGDSAWRNDYLAPTRHMVDRQLNTLLLPDAVDEATQDAACATGGPYYYSLVSSTDCVDSATAVGSRAQKCGTWRTGALAGTGGQLSLWRSSNLDSLLPAGAPPAGCSGKLLLPTTFAAKYGAQWY